MVGLASALVDLESGALAAIEGGVGAVAIQSECPDGLLAALAIYARPLVHTEAGQQAARTAFQLAGLGCWPTVGLREGGWPVTYREVLEVVLDAEAWVEHGPEAEFYRPPRRTMPAPFINELTPSRPGWPQFVPGNALAEAVEGRPEHPRIIRVLSTGNHASYPAATFSMWRVLLHEYDFELEDHSFDNRYCQLAGSCSIDERFAWLGEHLRGTVVETCSGLALKGFQDMPTMSEHFAELLTAGGAEALVARSDVLLCTHPPYSCRLFWPLVLRAGKPLLGFFGGTLEAHVPADGMEAWLRDFREMAEHPLVQFAAISPFLAEKMRYQTGAAIPSTRGFGFHVIARGVTYLPRRVDDVLLWKNSNECNDNQAEFDALLADMAGRSSGSGSSAPLTPLRFHHLRKLRELGESSYASIASFRAVVFMPYEVLLMTFYELYHVAIPLFLPDASLSAFLMYRGPVTYPHCDMVLEEQDDPESLPSAVRDWSTWRRRAPYSPFVRSSANDRLAWLEAYTDWYRFPHLQRFSGLAELVAGLRGVDLQAVSANMRLNTEGALVAAAVFWRRAFAKVLTAGAQRRGGRGAPEAG